MTEADSAETPLMKITEDLWAARTTPVLATATELDVFTHVARGKTSAAQIARAAGAKRRGMERLLDALVALGYLKKRSGDYGLEPVSREYLVRGNATYIGAIIDVTLRESWDGLTDVVRTGRPQHAVDLEAEARDFFPHLVRAIFPMSLDTARAALDRLPKKTIAGIQTLLDVAAGSAAWSIPFAQQIPAARVTAIDYGEVLEVTKEYTESFGVRSQYEFVDGNLRAVDFGRDQYDMVLLGHIIHSEGAKWGKRLIKKAYRALRPGGTLLIAEWIPNDTRTGPALPLIFGLNMLLYTEEGDVFTMKEYREWLKDAGFKRVRKMAVPAPSPLVLATK